MKMIRLLLVLLILCLSQNTIYAHFNNDANEVDILEEIKINPDKYHLTITKQTNIYQRIEIRSNEEGMPWIGVAIRIFGVFASYVVSDIANDVCRENGNDPLLCEVGSFFLGGVGGLATKSASKVAVKAASRGTLGANKTVAHITKKSSSKVGKKKMEIEAEIYSKTNRVIDGVENVLDFLSKKNIAFEALNKFSNEKEYIVDGDISSYHRRISGIRTSSSDGWIYINTTKNSTYGYSNTELKKMCKPNIVCTSKKPKDGFYFQNNIRNFYRPEYRRLKERSGLSLGVLIPLEAVPQYYLNPMQVTDTFGFQNNLDMIYKIGIKRNFGRVKLGLDYAATFMDFDDNLMDTTMYLHGGQVNISSSGRFVNFSLGLLFMSDKNFNKNVGLKGLSAGMEFFKGRLKLGLEANAYFVSVAGFNSANLQSINDDIYGFSDFNIDNLNYAVGGSATLYFTKLGLTGGIIYPLSSLSTPFQNSTNQVYNEAKTNLDIIPKVGLDFKMGAWKLGLKYAFTNAETTIENHTVNNFLHGIDVSIGSRLLGLNPKVGVLLLADRYLEGKNALKGASLGFDILSGNFKVGLETYGFLYDTKDGLGNFESPVTDVYSLERLSIQTLSYGVGGSLIYYF